jgi:hypothetical protein
LEDALAVLLRSISPLTPFSGMHPPDGAQAYLKNLLIILQGCQSLLLKQRLSRTGQRACA